MEAGLSPEDAFDTYSAVSVHVRGSVVLQRLHEKNRAAAEDGRSDFEEGMLIDAETAPLLARVTEKGHRIAAADDKNFEYALECILDHAERLIEGSKRPVKVARKTAKAPTRR